MVAIVTPSYNCGAYIEALARSIRKQTYHDWFWVVVDDGSTDETPAVLEKVSKKTDRMFVIQALENVGANGARQMGIEFARDVFLSEYLATGKTLDAVYFTDADAELYPQCLEKLTAALDKDPWNGFAYGCFHRVGKTNQEFYSSPWDPAALKVFNYISYMSLVRWDALIKALPLDNTLPALQDWDLWLTISEQGFKGVYVPEFLFKAYEREEGITNKMRNDTEHRARVIAQIKQKHNLKV